LDESDDELDLDFGDLDFGDLDFGDLDDLDFGDLDLDLELEDSCSGAKSISNSSLIIYKKRFTKTT
jgi:hypothetical protein